MLKGAAASHAVLTKGDSRKMTLIAGVNQSTITDAAIRDGEFEFTFSPEGDGTVPLAFAKLPSVPTYYIEGAHGSLPNNYTVQRAVIDILQQGATSLLDTQYNPPAARRAPVVERESAPYWPVSDFAATEFASVFYPLILEGKTVGESVLAGRKRLRETNERDWANYISYGSPDFVLKA